MQITSGATLRALMDQRGVSCADLARDAERSKGFIHHLTTGYKKTCRPEVAERIARRLDVPLSVLFVPSVSIVDGRATQQRRVA